MKIVFSNKDIKYSNIIIYYEDLKGDNGNKIIYKLLAYCIKHENEISFVLTDDCGPFGRKIKEILESEFNSNSNI